MLGSASVVKVVHARMQNQQAVIAVVRALRARPAKPDLLVSNAWGQPARTPAEIVRVSPISIAVRTLNLIREQSVVENVPKHWVCEGQYIPGDEAVFVSFDQDHYGSHTPLAGHESHLAHR